jgi:hypothetical protein
MSRQQYVLNRAALLKLMRDGRAVQAEARRKGSDRGKALSCELIYRTLLEMAALRAAYYRAA